MKETSTNERKVSCVEKRVLTQWGSHRSVSSWGFIIGTSPTKSWKIIENLLDKLGSNHPYVAAWDLFMERKKNAIKQLNIKSLNLRLKKLDFNHPDVGDSYDILGNKMEAKKCYENALSIYSQNFCKNNQDTKMNLICEAYFAFTFEMHCKVVLFILLSDDLKVGKANLLILLLQFFSGVYANQILFRSFRIIFTILENKISKKQVTEEGYRCQRKKEQKTKTWKPNNTNNATFGKTFSVKTFVLACFKQTEKTVKVMLAHWLRQSNVKLGWINDFNKIVARYVKQIYILYLLFFLKKILFIFAKYFKQLQILQGHSDMVRSAKFSPDSQKVISSSDDKTIRIWDIVLGKEIQQLKSNYYLINSAQFSPDGRTIVSCSQDATIQLWNVKSGEKEKILKGHSYSVWSVNFSPNGINLVSTSGDQTIRLWDVKSGKQIQTLSCYPDYVTDTQFSPDNQMLVCCSKGSKIILWSVTLRDKINKLKGHSGSVLMAQFSPDGRFIASCSNDKTIRIWDVRLGKEVKKLEGHLDAVWGIKFFSDGQTIVSCSDDKTIRLWDVQLGQEIQKLEGHVEGILGVDVSSDDYTIVSSSRDRTIRLWG
ncbi:G-protein beta WD-40 repeats containing protein [Reticulomyxa filosa]|uniref:G-protein beta WD-40 repeats containing protein n=2 Tax=Reticulomyxa filosa TaxID=46433 RepID=X6MP81_RETFI|nr:G-protein beta WD-40 repeats containing protein [Reticulomyxa filosa]|eukprot:ETO15461.1 G-protein beta WD-40 repeats containing protein [Reticulomyxa filosa]